MLASATPGKWNGAPQYFSLQFIKFLGAEYIFNLLWRQLWFASFDQTGEIAFLLHKLILSVRLDAADAQQVQAVVIVNE